MKPFSPLTRLVLPAVLLLSGFPVTADPGEGGQTVRRMEFLISGREVQRDRNSLRVTQGETVEMVWEGDEAGSLHLHGYDIEFEILPGEPTIVTFEAHATGRFPITSHGFGEELGHGHGALLYLEVYPE